ncbi:MAG: hypothetical protein Q619_VDC00129G0001, partial [Veillonella dispar DORA_11]
MPAINKHTLFHPLLPTTDDNGQYRLQFNGTYGKAYNDRGYNDGALLASNLYSDALLPDNVATAEG